MKVNIDVMHKVHHSSKVEQPKFMYHIRQRLALVTAISELFLQIAWLIFIFYRKCYLMSFLVLIQKYTKVTNIWYTLYLKPKPLNEECLASFLCWSHVFHFSSLSQFPIEKFWVEFNPISSISYLTSL